MVIVKRQVRRAHTLSKGMAGLAASQQDDHADEEMTGLIAQFLDKLRLQAEKGGSSSSGNAAMALSGIEAILDIPPSSSSSSALALGSPSHPSGHLANVVDESTKQDIFQLAKQITAIKEMKLGEDHPEVMTLILTLAHQQAASSSSSTSIRLKPSIYQEIIDSYKRIIMICRGKGIPTFSVVLSQEEVTNGEETFYHWVMEEARHGEYFVNPLVDKGR